MLLVISIAANIAANSRKVPRKSLHTHPLNPIQIVPNNARQHPKTPQPWGECRLCSDCYSSVCLAAHAPGGWHRLLAAALGLAQTAGAKEFGNVYSQITL